MQDLRKTSETVWQTYSGTAAWQMVVDLSRFHRIQASPGHRQAAKYIHQVLETAGMEAEILTYPANEATSFWARPSFQEWECSSASLHLVAPQADAKVLAEFRACPISLIQRSTSYDGEAEVILLEDGEEEGDYDGLDLAGKVVLTRGDLRRVWELAVQERGAAGILFDGMRPVSPVRPEGDLADVRQYTSFWWQAGDTRCFGFVLTPRQGQALRRMLEKGQDPVRIQAQVQSRLYDGAFEVVTGSIPGQVAQEIVVVAHLCHPRPSANDNASGAAAALEAARTLQALIAAGELPCPRRTIRFLWLPEMTGTYAYLASREADLEQIVAGINLDMVGEDQNQTGSSWLIERPPDAAASFASDLLARLRDELPGLKGMTDVSPSHTGLGAYALYRQAEVAFSGGSDHYILSDPSVGVPTPMLSQWPDRFYHTSADTADRTDPQSLARAGSLAAIYAHWLAAAGSGEVIWLGHEMTARFKTRVVDTAQATVTRALTMEDAESLSQALAELERKLAYLFDLHKSALLTLRRLAPIECLADDMLAEAEQVVNRGLSWAMRAAGLHAATLHLETLPAPSLQELTGEELEAKALIPARQVKGPIPLESHVRDLDDADREAWRQLLKTREGWGHYTLTTVALYWADGARSLLDIIDRVEMETGIRDVELVLAYFRLLEKLDFVTL